MHDNISTKNIYIYIYTNHVICLYDLVYRAYHRFGIPRIDPGLPLHLDACFLEEVVQNSHEPWEIIAARAYSKAHPLEN